MKRLIKWIQVVVAVSCFGTAYQSLNCVGRAAQAINPCGTILVCDPLEYDLAFSSLLPDYELDPTCTIPGLCGTTPYPGGSAGQGGVTTGGAAVGG